MDRKQWDNRDITSEEIQKEIEELERQILAFELRVKYENKLTAFRTIYLEWYEGRLSLMELLTAMMDGSICNRITPFPR